MASLKSYLADSYNELVNKVSWPSFSELQQASVLVFVASLIIALIIFLMDWIFGVNSGEDKVWKGLLGFIYEFLLK